MLVDLFGLDDMTLRNSTNEYGLIARVFHWVSVVVVAAMFAVGTWMVELTYYNPWYKTAPHYHKSVGIIFAIFIVMRLVWRFVEIKPRPLSSHSNFERVTAHWVHIVIYVLLFSLFLSGYFISTIEGEGIQVFNWFTVPSLIQGEGELSDIAGEIHELLGWTLVGLVSLHALAALKHHLIDKDDTLRRMISMKNKR